MDTGKILIGIALVLLSAALMVSPSNAAGTGSSREVGNGSVSDIMVNAIPTDTSRSMVATGTQVISPVGKAAAGEYQEYAPVPVTHHVPVHSDAKNGIRATYSSS